MSNKIDKDRAMVQMYSKIEDSMTAIKDAKLDHIFKLGVLEGSSVFDKGLIAQLVLNTQREFGAANGPGKLAFEKMIKDSADPSREFMTTGSYGPYIPQFLPLITAWYQSFPLNDLISVQPMDQPFSLIHHTEYSTATTKADTTAGEIVSTPDGPRKIRGRYSTGEIFQEELIETMLEYVGTAQATQGITVYVPMNTIDVYKDAYMLEVTSTDAAVAGKYIWYALNPTEILLENSSGNTAKLEIGSGLISINEPSSAMTISKVLASYVWNLELSEERSLPKIKETIRQKRMEATPRALGLEWSVFAEFSKKSQFGKDIRTDAAKNILDIVYDFQTRYALDRLYQGAEGLPMTIGNIPNYPDQASRLQWVRAELAKVSHQVMENTGRMEGNRIVTGKNFKIYLETLPVNEAKLAPSDVSSMQLTPRKYASFGKYEVFYDPTIEDNQCYMTYRGKEWYDAAYYMGEYMPITASAALQHGAQVRSAFCSMEAHFYDKKHAVIPFTVGTF